MHFHTSTLVSLALLATSASAIQCYGSGKWAKRLDGLDMANEACKQMAAMNVPKEFMRTACVNGPNNIKWEFSASVPEDKMAAGVCVQGMTRILNTCRGNNDDSRGGNKPLGADGDYYKLDPNDGRC